MAVTYAQFIVEYPEYSELGQSLVQARLTFWDGFLSGFKDAHDEAVYVRTALNLSERVFSLPMNRAEGSEDRYKAEWERILHQNPRRMTVSGGGLT